MRLGSLSINSIFIFTNLITEKEMFTRNLPSKHLIVGQVLNFHESGQPNNKEYYIKKVEVQVLEESIITHVKLMPL